MPKPKSLLELVLAWTDVGTIPTTALSAHAQEAGTEGKWASESFFDSLIDKLTTLITAAARAGAEWSKQKRALDTAMGKTFDSFGLGLTEEEKLTRLGQTYTETMVGKFNSTLFGEMFDPESSDSHPFVQFWSEHDDRVCEDCRPMDGGIFRKDDPDLGIILPEIHFNCRCWIEEVTREQAADQIQLYHESAGRFIGNVDEDFRYDKRNEQEVAL